MRQRRGMIEVRRSYSSASTLGIKLVPHIPLVSTQVENPKRQGVREIVKAVGSNAERDRIWHQLARKNRQKVNWPRLQDFHFRAARRRLRAARRRFLRAVAP